MTRPVLATVTDAIAPFHAGGKEQRTAELTRRLTDRFDVHVHTMRWWGAGTWRHEGVTHHGVCRPHAMYVGGRRSIRQAVAFALGCLRLLVARFDVLEADHMPYLHLPVLALVAKVRRRPLVVTWHEVWSRDYWRDYLGPAGTLAWAFERFTMRLPDLVVAASAETALRIGEVVRVPVVVAPNGVDLASVDAALAGTDDVPTVDVVTVGRLLPHKRVDMLLDALGGGVSARVIGRGPQEGFLTARAAEQGLDVTVHTDVDDPAELYRLVAAARVFVLPSAREGFGIVALEAVACGLPVITTAAPDNLARHLVADAPGGVVCADDVTALAHAIRTTLDDPPDRTGAPAWLAHHGWDGTADRVAAALGSVLPRAVVSAAPAVPALPAVEPLPLAPPTVGIPS
ncbi:glycosyltransferase family 4 protein [Actinomycetospora termitidis]|uniref:Glycosyltransferase family 4 protein n=1 Tax=Actinomycetospora termitidis TaxID=3053470 RepID=A0ABT7MFX1_9PSEU|nr:glycosyltransferase family 4 protein [Actinomycetospora sp. Odt1-22]MDL5159560.1 glycosyltransferase family 4 protein [Actinomycetospora sp. Odt1-22]